MGNSYFTELLVLFVGLPIEEWYHGTAKTYLQSFILELLTPSNYNCYFEPFLCLLERIILSPEKKYNHALLLLKYLFEKETQGRNILIKKDTVGFRFYREFLLTFAGEKELQCVVENIESANENEDRKALLIMISLVVIHRQRKQQPDQKDQMWSLKEAIG